MDLNNVSALVLITASLFALICRVNRMSKQTSNVVFYQHFALALGLFASLWFHEYALHLVVGGVLVFLLMGASRWFHGAPPGIQKEMSHLSQSEMRKVWGRGDK